MRGTGGFSIVLIMVGGITVITSMLNNEEWLNAPKVVAPATVSDVVGCNIIDDENICIAKISRPMKQPAVWNVKLQNEYDVLTQGQKVYRLCWYTVRHNDPTCFDNAILEPVGPWRNARRI